MNSYPISCDTAILKEFAKHYKSLLTQTTGCVADTALKQRLAELSAIRRLRVQGANLQTIQKDLRLNYVADDGYDFFQCDLEGADGWTVAAQAARLGDPTMWDDYTAGMKPAKLIALMYWFGPAINEFDREELKWLHDHIFPIVIELAGKWLYLGCKRVQHGSSYMMGIPTMCLNILKDSFKESGTPDLHGAVESPATSRT